MNSRTGVCWGLSARGSINLIEMVLRNYRVIFHLQSRRRVFRKSNHGSAIAKYCTFHTYCSGQTWRKSCKPYPRQLSPVRSILFDDHSVGTSSKVSLFDCTSPGLRQPTASDFKRGAWRWPKSILWKGQYERRITSWAINRQSHCQTISQRKRWIAAKFLMRHTSVSETPI